MPSFSTEVEHQLGQEEATQRLKNLVDQVRQQYSELVTEMDGDWADNVLTFKLITYGFKIDGVLTVEDQAAKLAGTLPFAALPFRGKIEQTITGELRRELGQ